MNKKRCIHTTKQNKKKKKDWQFSLRKINTTMAQNNKGTY